MASEAKYIVKSANRVLGPYTIDDVAGRVSRRELNMLDEIRTPDMRWCFVREVPAFKDLIERIRNEEMNRGEHTQTSLTHTSRTMTSTGITHATIEEAGPPIPVRAKETALSSQASAGGYGLKGAGGVGSTNSKASLVRNVLLAMLTFVVVIGAIQYFRPKTRGPNKSQMVEFARYAEELARLGRYSESLSFLMKDEKNQYLSPEQMILKAKLLLMPPAQIVEARKALEGVSQTKDDHLRSQVVLVRSLLGLREQRWSEADQGFRSLSGNSLFETDSKLNLAVLRYLTGNSAAAFQLVSQIPLNVPQKTFVGIMKGLSLWNDRSGTIPIRPEVVASEMEEVAESSREDRFKLNLIAAALYIKAGQREQVQRVVDGMMNMNSFTGEMFLRNLGIDYSPVEWERLGNLCDQVVQNTNQPQKGMALQAQCRFLEGQQGGALTLIEQSRRQYSTDLSLAAVHALLLREADRGQEARSLIDFLDGKTSLLGELVRADSCIKDGDWACAEKSLQIIRSADSREPMVYYGLGQLAKQRGQSEVVREMITQGLRIYPRYRPLLELKGDSYAF